MEGLTKNLEAAEKSLDVIGKSMDECREYTRINREVLESLKEETGIRKELMADFMRIQRMYDSFAGKMSGARMDIETFVQRRFLEQILHNANKRFTVMSNGQYELRMYDLDKAGEGKTAASTLWSTLF